jgi:hypothetical protein
MNLRWSRPIYKLEDGELSVLRLHKLPTIHACNVVRHLGSLSVATVSKVDDKLRALLSF